MEKKNLSKSILQMKFMKKTKQKVEKDEDDEEGRTLYASEITNEMRNVKSNYVLESSYVPCEDLMIGRVSFRGLNPEIESILEEERNVKLAQTAAETFKNEQLMKTDISDADMLRTYNTNNLTKTISRKFQKNKRQHSKSNYYSGPENKKACFIKPTS